MGSTFTLFLPLKYVGPDQRSARRASMPRRHRRCTARRRSHAPRPDRPVEHIPDDRLEIEPGDTHPADRRGRSALRARLLDLARDQGFKVLVAARGADALDLAKQYQPTAVSLDVFLPDMLGWTVLSQLKQNPLTRHIPVQIITLDEDRQHGWRAARSRSSPSRPPPKASTRR